MLRVPVESSDIVAVGYDDPSQTLEIEFQGGRIYQYIRVPADIHKQFLAADSHGQYFNTFIHGHYRYERITDDAPSLPDSIAFATGSQRKLNRLREACEHYALIVEQLALDVDEIQSDDAEKIAMAKAKSAYKLAGRPVVVNDAHWNILALRGFPGAYMSAISHWLKAEEWLRLMEDKTDRTIMLTETIAYYDGNRTKIFQREYRGTVLEAPQGPGVQSIERIVVLHGNTQSIAELMAQDAPSIEPDESVWHDFAKWFNIQRKLRKA